jgi:mono/diheme cytochrome c family protein
VFINDCKPFVLLLLAALTLAACSVEESATAIVPGRWYTAEQIERGEALFQTHCASCHGERAQGLVEDWRKTDANGNYPPPPLNGTAHAWHHPMVVLEQTIAEGGVALGGVMPGFATTLSENDIKATVAYFQSAWSEEIYARWQEIDRQ